MKNKLLYSTLFFAVALISLSSCKRDFPITASVQTTEGTAYLAVVHASPNIRKIFNAQDSFNVFINGEKISGFTPGTISPFMTYGATFPSTSSGFGYFEVTPGQLQIKLSVSGKVNPDSIEIITLNRTLLAGHQYSFIITDSITSLRDSSRMFIEDIYRFPPTVGYYNLRFVNAVVNDTAKVDLFSYAKNGVIYSGIRPDSATAFNQIGANLQVTDTLYITRTLATGVPSSTPLSQRTILAKMSFAAGNQKSYTVYYRGDFTLPTTNAKSRAITFYRHE
ncbi:MAG TPA: DUF4397 domain-containing protein [Chitinophagaceae bacterium]